MRRILVGVCLALLFSSCNGFGNRDNIVLDSDAKKASYILGRRLGEQIKAQPIDLNIDVDVLAMAIKDVLSGRESRLTASEEKEIMGKVRQKLMAHQLAELRKKSQKDKEALEKAEKFLEENKKRPGVYVTKSGLQYEIIKKGTGPSPTLDDKVVVHYRGTLTDGTEFDSSYKRGKPAVFALKDIIIQGWREALPMMKKGAKWKIYIPPELGYGAHEKPGIPANSVMIFEVELLDVLKGAAKAEAKAGKKKPVIIRIPPRKKK